MYRRVAVGLVFVGLLVALCLWAVLPLDQRIKLGLDLKGGTLLQYRLSLEDIPSYQHASIADEVKKVIYQRLDQFGLKEIEVRVVGRDRVQIAIPGVSLEEIRDLKDQVGRAGNLSLHLAVDEFTDKRPGTEDIQKIRVEWQRYRQEIIEWNRRVEQLGAAAAGPQPREPDRVACVQYERDKDGEFIIDPTTKERKEERWWILHNEPQNWVSGRYVSSAHRTIDPKSQSNAVAFTFKGVGASQLSSITRDNKGKLLAIVLDEVVLSAPAIQAHLTDGSGIITGQFRDTEANGLANILSVGSLPTSPILTQEQSIGSRLGQDSIRRGRTAIIIGFLAVVAFMAVYYLGAGLIADFALFFNLLLILAYVAVFGQTMSFPGIAGVLLTVGMAVDANILIFERIREELKKGKPLPNAVGAAYKRAFWTIFDANLTTFITALVLFRVGTGPIQGFAITLMAGLAANFLTSLYVSRLFLSTFYKLGVIKELKMFEAFATPKIPFIRHRGKFALLSLVLIVTGLAVLFARGRDCVGIDFRGGMEMTVNLSRPLAINAFRTQLAGYQEDGERLFAEAQVQSLLTTSEGSYGFIVRVPAAARAAPRIPDRPVEPAAVDGPSFEPTGPAAFAPVAPVTPVTEDEPPAVTPPAEAPPPAHAPDADAPAADSPTSSGTVEGTAAPGETLAAPFPALEAPPDRPVQARPPLETRYRRALEKLLAEYLAPEPFPVIRETTGLNPDMRSVVMEVHLYIGTSADAVTRDFGERLAALMDAHIERERAARAGAVSRTPLGAFRIGGVEWLGSQDAYTRYRITTTPVKYGDPDAPLGMNDVVSVVRGFFSSDFYREQLSISPDLLQFREFSLSEPLPSVSFVDSAVAEDFQGAAMLAILISLLAIIFYIAIRFEFTFGLGAVAALVHDVLFGLGALAVVDYLCGSTFSVKIDLPVVAAFLTIIGYSLNDSIVVFDRIRENMSRAKKYVLEDLVNTSINETLSRTLWTSLTTFLVVFVLLVWGGETVQSFAFVMLVGVVVGTYSSIFVASPAMIYLRHRKERKHEERLREAAEHGRRK